jgi:uncharacterized membrane protein YdjX (TVP38/TMEM64 family)
MEKSKKIKIFIGIFYSISLFLFLFLLFSKFNLDEITSYKFIQSNRDYFFDLKNSNLLIISFLFFIFTVFFIFMLGFGSPIAILGGFIFGKWIGTILVVLGLSVGSMLLYIFANFFLKDFIKEKFLHKFKNFENKFKKNEFFFFLFFRFVGGIPFQIANVLPVLFNVSIKNYFIGTFLGLMPSIFIITSLGSGLERIINKNETAPSIIELLSSPDIYTPIIFFTLLVLITLILKKVFFKD